MSFTYVGDLSTDREKLRFYIGDTDSTMPQFSDQELDALLVMYPNPLNAAIQACYALIGKYSRYTAETVGRVSVDYSKLVDNYMKLLQSLQMKAATSSGGLVYAGGISKQDQLNNNQDSDISKPSFTKTMNDNKEVQYRDSCEDDDDDR